MTIARAYWTCLRMIWSEVASKKHTLRCLAWYTKTLDKVNKKCLVHVHVCYEMYIDDSTLYFVPTELFHKITGNATHLAEGTWERLSFDPYQEETLHNKPDIQNRTKCTLTTEHTQV